MKDQVDGFEALGIAADTLNSAQEENDFVKTREGILNGTLKLLYVAPERLNLQSFHTVMESAEVSMLAVDEAHCISEWGMSFRPDYLKIARFAKEKSIPLVLACTATAPPDVALDICRRFDLDPEEGLIRASSYRPKYV